MKAECFILEVLWDGGWVRRTSYRKLDTAIYNGEVITLVPARVRRFTLSNTGSDGTTVWDPAAEPPAWQNHLAERLTTS